MPKIPCISYLTGDTFIRLETLAGKSWKFAEQSLAMRYLL